MPRFFLAFLLGMTAKLCFGQVANLIRVGNNQAYYISKPENNQILIFLHGGVNNPRFQPGEALPPLSFLLEENTLLVDLAMANGFDLLFPITNDSLNWLKDPEYCYKTIRQFISQKNYQKPYITGFSDGGTGSYKIFYSHPDFFDGLVIFNGYPQHKNFYQKANYEKLTDKKVVFASTFKDQVIPYEFALTEYAKQKQFNANTYLYIQPGGHSFSDYTPRAFNLVVSILTSATSCKDHEALHGYVASDTLVEFYPFRKKIVRKFAYGEEFYKENQRQQKVLKGR